jgi:small subunit ribosomal protein S20
LLQQDAIEYICALQIKIMAHHKSSLKRIRQEKKRRTENRYHAKTTRNAVRDLLKEKDSTKATKSLPAVVSLIDKLAKKGVIHRNKAANLKSNVARHAKSAK